MLGEVARIRQLRLDVDRCLQALTRQEFSSLRDKRLIVALKQTASRAAKEPHFSSAFEAVLSKLPHDTDLSQMASLSKIFVAVELLLAKPSLTTKVAFIHELGDTTLFNPESLPRTALPASPAAAAAEPTEGIGDPGGAGDGAVAQGGGSMSSRQNYTATCRSAAGIIFSGLREYTHPYAVLVKLQQRRQLIIDRLTPLLKANPELYDVAGVTPTTLIMQLSKSYADVITMPLTSHFASNMLTSDGAYPINIKKLTVVIQRRTRFLISLLSVMASQYLDTANDSTVTDTSIEQTIDFFAHMLAPACHVALLTSLHDVMSTVVTTPTHPDIHGDYLSTTDSSLVALLAPENCLGNAVAKPFLTAKDAAPILSECAHAINSISLGDATAMSGHRILTNSFATTVRFAVMTADLLPNDCLSADVISDAFRASMGQYEFWLTLGQLAKTDGSFQTCRFFRPTRNALHTQQMCYDAFVPVMGSTGRQPPSTTTSFIIEQMRATQAAIDAISARHFRPAIASSAAAAASAMPATEMGEIPHPERTAPIRAVIARHMLHALAQNRSIGPEQAYRSLSVMRCYGSTDDPSLTELLGYWSVNDDIATIHARMDSEEPPPTHLVVRILEPQVVSADLLAVALPETLRTQDLQRRAVSLSRPLGATTRMLNRETAATAAIESTVYDTAHNHLQRHYPASLPFQRDPFVLPAEAQGGSRAYLLEALTLAINQLRQTPLRPAQQHLLALAHRKLIQGYTAGHINQTAATISAAKLLWRAALEPIAHRLARYVIAPADSFTTQDNVTYDTTLSEQLQDLACLKPKDRRGARLADDVIFTLLQYPTAFITLLNTLANTLVPGSLNYQTLATYLSACTPPMSMPRSWASYCNPCATNRFSIDAIPGTLDDLVTCYDPSQYWQAGPITVNYHPLTVSAAAKGFFLGPETMQRLASGILTFQVGPMGASFSSAPAALEQQLRDVGIFGSDIWRSFEFVDPSNSDHCRIAALGAFNALEQYQLFSNMTHPMAIKASEAIEAGAFWRGLTALDAGETLGAVTSKRAMTYSSTAKGTHQIQLRYAKQVLEAQMHQKMWWKPAVIVSDQPGQSTFVSFKKDLTMLCQ